MSERQKSKTPSEKAPFLRSARQLLAETARITRSEKIVPKRARWQYAYEIMWLANQYHSWAMYANGIKVLTHGLMVARYEAQARALGWLYALDAKVSLMVDAEEIDPDLLTNWADLKVEAWDATVSWQSSDLRRYSKQFGSLTADELRELTVLSGPDSLERSPNPSNCNNVRNVTPTGTLNNNNANNTNGVVGDRENARIE